MKQSFNGENTISITCDVENYLGKKETLKAYNQSEDTEHNGNNLDSLSVSVVLRVIAEDRSGTIIRNEASINVVQNGDLQDRDSNVNTWQGKDGEKIYQDDEDYELAILGRLDLALAKFAIAVSNDITIEDGEYLTQDGKQGSPYTRLIGINTKDLRDDQDCHDAIYNITKDALVVPLKSYILYNIRIYNEGGIDTYASKITDYLPDYLDYVYCDFNDRYGWSLAEDGKTISTNYLGYKNGQTTNLLKAFNKQIDDGEGLGLDYKDIQIICRVNERATIETSIVNVAEITGIQDEDGNEISDDVDSISQNIDEKNEDNDDHESVLAKNIDLKDEYTVEEKAANSQAENTSRIPKIIIFVVIGLAIIVLFIIELILIKKYILI